jgi:large subunit ribosomal protein L24
MKKLKKGDKVLVVTGKYKGKEGEILALLPEKNRVMVKGIAIVTRHVKARKQGQISGIIKEEGYIHASNVMPIHPDTRKPCRVNKLPSVR